MTAATTAAAPSARDLYLRHTATDGNGYVQCHRVWDADIFIAARQREAQKANADVKGDDAPRRARIDIVTRDQYLNSRKSA